MVAAPRALLPLQASALAVGRAAGRRTPYARRTRAIIRQGQHLPRVEIAPSSPFARRTAPTIAGRRRASPYRRPRRTTGCRRAAPRTGCRRASLWRPASRPARRPRRRRTPGRGTPRSGASPASRARAAGARAPAARRGRGGPRGAAPVAPTGRRGGVMSAGRASRPTSRRDAEPPVEFHPTLPHNAPRCPAASARRRRRDRGRADQRQRRARRRRARVESWRSRRPGGHGRRTAGSRFIVCAGPPRRCR